MTTFAESKRSKGKHQRALPIIFNHLRITNQSIQPFIFIYMDILASVQDMHTRYKTAENTLFFYVQHHPT